MGFGVSLLRETILEGLDPEGAQMPGTHLGSHIPTLRTPPLLPELPSLPLPKNGDWHLHLVLRLQGAKQLVCVVPGRGAVTGNVPQGVLGLAGEGLVPSCVWAHVCVLFRILGV